MKRAQVQECLPAAGKTCPLRPASEGGLYMAKGEDAAVKRRR